MDVLRRTALTPFARVALSRPNYLWVLPRSKPTWDLFHWEDCKIVSHSELNKQLDQNSTSPTFSQVAESFGESGWKHVPLRKTLWSSVFQKLPIHTCYWNEASSLYPLFSFHSAAAVRTLLFERIRGRDTFSVSRLERGTADFPRLAALDYAGSQSARALFDEGK